MKIAKRLFFNLLNRVNDRLGIIPYNRLLEYFVNKYYHKDFFFLQIGGNDGVTYDPLVHITKKMDLSGLIVEPINSYFKQLELLYLDNKKITVANYAIYSCDGPIKMYKTREHLDQMPDWSKGIASLDINHHKKSGIPSTSIEEEIVQGITLENLFKKYKIGNIDLLVIDTEGYDYYILKSINFKIFKPKLILFEHGYIDNIMTISQINEILEVLIKNNYKFAFMDYDCLAYL